MDEITERKYLDFKIAFSRRFHVQYHRTILAILLLVIAKRVIMKGYFTISEVVIHFSTLVIFFLLSKLYNLNNKSTRYMPYIYALISYYSHTVFIFKGIFDVEGDPSQVHMSKDSLIRHIIQFAALSFNLIYINVFLIFHRKDCIILNLITLTLFCRDVYMQPGKFNKHFKAISKLSDIKITLFIIGLTIQSSLSAFFLSVFSFKFTLEAQKLKDEIFTLYYQKDQSSKQWIEIFENLPVGVLLVNDDRIVHFNESIRHMLGVSTIRKEQKVAEFNMEIHTNSNGFTSHQKNGGGDTSSSSFEIRQTFANFLQGLGRGNSSSHKEGGEL